MWKASRLPLMVTALEWMMRMPSKRLSIRYYIIASISFNACKTSLSSKVEPLSYSNNRSMGRLAFLKSSSDSYL